MATLTITDEIVTASGGKLGPLRILPLPKPGKVTKPQQR